jgi:outer membrane protein assembly factor BamB
VFASERGSIRGAVSGCKGRSGVVSRSLFALMVTLVIAATVITAGSVSAQASSSTDWTSYLNGPSHSSYNAAATSITTAGVNAGNLQPVWRWVPPASTVSGATNSFKATPVVSNGVFYVGVEDGSFYAVSEATQQILWSDFLGVDQPKPDGLCSPTPQGITATATVAPDPVTGTMTVYVNGANGILYALNAATGAIVWQATVDTPSTTIDDYYGWSSPTVANGSVYVGVASWCDLPVVQGGVRAFDQETGAQTGSWNTVTPPNAGGDVWSSVAALPNGSVVASTGNGPGNAQECGGCTNFTGPPGPLHDQSIVRLGGSSLNLLDAWQVPTGQACGDCDFGGSPTVFTADIGGVSTPMVGACNKNGTYYALAQDDLAAGPVWQDQIEEGGANRECDAAAIWDGTDLIQGGGAPTTIGSTTYLGSVQALNPSTGQPVWQTGLPGPVIGSCSEDGSGVVACGVYTADTPQDMGFYILSAATGQILEHISTPSSFLFSQPVFDNNDLILTGNDGIGVTGYEMTTPGAPITSVVPNVVQAGASTTVTLTGSGFTAPAEVFVSGTNVGGEHPATVLSPTQLSFTLAPTSMALSQLTNVTVVEPGSPEDVAMVCNACLDVNSQLQITATSPLPAGTQWQNYDQSIGIMGGATPYATSIISGQMPPGLSLDQSGNLTGVITSAGTYTFTVQVTDSSTPTPQVVTATYTLVVAAASEPQAITFTSTNPSPVTLGAPTYTPTATASSGLPVTITLDSASSGCTLSGGVVSFVAAGTCVIDANQAGNGTYAAAPQLQQSITINSGAQTMTVSPSTLSAGSKGNTLTFTYTAATGGISSGVVEVAVPTGWPDAPSLTSSKAGYVTSTCGTLSLVGRTIKTTAVTLAAGQTCTIIYGSKAGGGPGAVAPTAAGASTFTASESSTSSGTPTALATSPVVTV